MTDHIARALEDDRWEGFGYLGMRKVALDDSDPEAPAVPDVVARTDAWLASLNLDYETFFEWANSKLGRHFADQVFGALPETPLEERLEAARKFHTTPEYASIYLRNTNG